MPIDLVARWRQGDQQAADELFRLYAQRLVALARSRLSTQLDRRIDAEDVVQSAFRSFFHRARDGPLAPHDGELWGLLVAIMLHKLHVQVQRHTADKRSINREQTFGGEDSLRGLHAAALAQDPSPLEAVALGELVERLMQRLPPRARRVLELRLQGYNLDEIAAEASLSRRSVCRLIDQIKQQLEHELANATESRP